MADFSIKAFDRLPSIRAQLMTELDELPVDLTAASSVEFIMVSAVGSAPKVNAVAVIESPPTAGIVRYDWTAADTNLPGNYLAEFEVTWVGGKKQSFPTGSYLTISVLADLDGA